MAGRSMAPPLPPLLLLLAVATCLGLARACSVVPGGCTRNRCSALSSIANSFKPSGATDVVPRDNVYNLDQKIGFLFGVFNKKINNGRATGAASVRGGPWVNYETFPQVETKYLLGTTDATTLSACCFACAKTENCTIYQFFVSGTVEKNLNSEYGSATVTPPGFIKGTQCYLLSGGSVKSTSTDNQGPRGTPRSGSHNQQVTDFKKFPASYVGGACNPLANTTDDPHFVGAHGTHYDFNGDIGKSFVLISDERWQINIKLGGYWDSRTFGASIQKDGKAIRTWIKEVGFIWKDEAGQRHTAHFVARAGKQEARGPGGFLARFAVDGTPLPVPAEGEKLTRESLSLEFLKAGKIGPYDAEFYMASVPGLFDINLHMRPAHNLLQSPDNAHVHFNIHVNQIEATDKIHGILGQTFRTTMSQRLKALQYSTLSRLIGGPIAADGPSGLGFLDGEPNDYITSDILATDSRFSSFSS